MPKEARLTRKHFWMIAVNSTSAYVLAFLFVFYLNHFANMFTSSMFNITVSFDWDYVYYHIEPYEWTFDAVKTIFSVGPVLIFIVGLISLIAFFSLLEEQAIIKIFFIWLTFHSFNFFFGNLLIGNIFKQGIGHVFNWMFLTDTQKLIVAMIGFFGLLGTAFVMTGPVITSANSYFSKMDDDKFPFFFTAQIIVPFVLGTIIGVGYFIPRILFQERYSWISLGVILWIIYMRLRNHDPIYFDEDDRFPHYSWVLIIITVVVYAGFRILFNTEHLFFMSR